MSIILAAGMEKALVLVTISLHPGAHHVLASYTLLDPTGRRAAGEHGGRSALRGVRQAVGARRARRVPWRAEHRPATSSMKPNLVGGPRQPWRECCLMEH
jgi:hypothetical protein